MKRKLILAAFLFLFICFFGLTVFAASPITEEKLKEVLPQAESFVYNALPLAHYAGYKAKEVVGFVFETAQLEPEERGYNGPINILVGMNVAGELSGIKILEHSETPSYTAKIYSKEFRSQFIGKSAYAPLQTGLDIDAITQATISSEAIARAVRKSMRRVASEMLKLENLPKEPGLFDEFKRGRIYLVIFLLLFGLWAFLSRKQSLRWIILFGSFAYFGWAMANFISVVNFINLSEGKFPLAIGNLHWYVFLFFILALTLIWGRVYCGYLCPFGLICALSRKFALGKIEPGFKLARFASYSKFLIVIALLIIYLITRAPGLFSYEVFVTLFTRRAPIAAWLLLAVSILAMLSGVSYFWCRFFCPAGAMLGIISRFSLSRQKLNCKGPEQCRLCSESCPMGCIDPVKKTISSLECIRCNICLDKCPHKDEKR